ncbi:SIS domain-containing protein [Bacteriovorax sp. Seq25_V]|uniref:KpsF/GutQ family sugar-phosphate isomerase n=1 Tax=Bacteriovorax sp. Seq25_V TaxID=1201288 RepID=UPI00038A34EA|nr:KpsF/GutQ family sugar-phosphate isomerase [Bacteriovorax sp. Seq25_V]EQC43482.1 sugar isomerase, KpsF/GutQ family [Bacteriovorax sp. Seq25_V]
MFNHIEIAKRVITSEIAGLKSTMDALDKNFSNVIEQILSSTGRVIITGMGKSGIIGRKIAATLSSTGTPSYFLHPGEAYHGDLGLIDSNDHIIAISNSGETDEVIKLLPFFKDNKNIITAITNNPNSTLALHSTNSINISIKDEACPLKLAPTTTTTATLVIGDSIAIALMEARQFKPENFARFHPGGQLGRKLLTRAHHIMSTEMLPFVSTDSSFPQLVSTMSQSRFGTALVTDNDKLVGIITDGDLRRSFAKYNEKITTIVAHEIMSKSPVTIDKDASFFDMERLFTQMKISLLIVTEGNGKVIGLVNIHDLQR